MNAAYWNVKNAADTIACVLYGYNVVNVKAHFVQAVNQKVHQKIHYFWMIGSVQNVNLSDFVSYVFI